MKRCGVWFFVLLISALVPPSLSYGEATSSTVNEKEGSTARPSWLAIGLRSNYFRLTDSRRKIVGNLIALEEDQNYIPLNPVIQANLSKYIALELSMSQYKTMTLNNDYLRFSSDGDLSWTSFMLGAQFRWPHFKIPLIPYFSGGVSYNKTTFGRTNWYYYGFPDPATYYNWVGQGNKPEDFPNGGYRRIHQVDDTYGVYLGLGADYFLTKHWAVNLDWRYQWATANWTYSLVNNDGPLRAPETGTAVLNSWTLGLGVKYLF